MNADMLIEKLALQPHPEGGFYRETFRDKNPDGRDFSTAIYYLLRAGEQSQWHRVDAIEIWHFYAGEPLKLAISEDGKSVSEYVLGNDLSAGHIPQIIVPRHAWQAAKPLGAFTLVGCTVAPAFEFSGFEMAADGALPAF